jgi:hypothetical protein
MSTFLGIVITAVSVCTFAAVVALFISAAKKDGDKDRAVQKRLGIRRRTGAAIASQVRSWRHRPPGRGLCCARRPNARGAGAAPA